MKVTIERIQVAPPPPPPPIIKYHVELSDLEASHIVKYASRDNSSTVRDIVVLLEQFGVK